MSSEAAYDLAGKRVWVAGHKGMVGSALIRRLAGEGCEIITADRKDADLKRQAEVEAWMAAQRPDAIFLAAAKVGGILANDTYPADFLFDNLMIQANIVEAAHRNGVGKLMILGSSCIYPRLAPQPIEESSLLTGPLEPTNEWYAIAKIAGIKLGQAYRIQHGCDDALVHLMKTYSDLEHVNVGSGEDVTILELAQFVAEVVGFQGQIITDTSKPDGTPRKLMAADKLRGQGWSPKITLKDGIASVYAWFLENQAAIAA
jgi:nucleoside-diphosphate-sugar epimerase